MGCKDVEEKIRDNFIFCIVKFYFVSRSDTQNTRSPDMSLRLVFFGLISSKRHTISQSLVAQFVKNLVHF